MLEFLAHCITRHLLISLTPPSASSFSGPFSQLHYSSIHLIQRLLFFMHFLFGGFTFPASIEGCMSWSSCYFLIAQENSFSTVCLPTAFSLLCFSCSVLQGAHFQNTSARHCFLLLFSSLLVIKLSTMHICMEVRATDFSKQSTPILWCFSVLPPVVLLFQFSTLLTFPLCPS